MGADLPSLRFRVARVAMDVKETIVLSTKYMDVFGRGRSKQRPYRLRTACGKLFEWNSKGKSSQRRGAEYAEENKGSTREGDLKFASG
jgi:hypothetical protein